MNVEYIGKSSYKLKRRTLNGKWNKKRTETARRDYSGYSKCNGISMEFLEKSIQCLINILGTLSATYKDRIFRMLLKKKKIALEIYNAINDSEY